MRPWVIRFGRVGDMVLQSVLFHHLRLRYGSPCGLITSGAWSADLYRNDPNVGVLKQLRLRHMPAWMNPEHWTVAQQIRSCRGPFYVSEDSPRQVGKVRWILHRAGVSPDRCVFLSDHSSALTHWIDRLNAFGSLTPRAFEGTAPIVPGQQWDAPKLCVTPADRLDAETWLRRRGIAERPLVLLQPGNRRTMRKLRSRQRDTKSWPTENWAAIACHVLNHVPECHVLICGSSAEQELLTSIVQRARSNRITAATCELPLRRLMALTEVAHSMISVDSGPAHMASALGCPLVVLYGAELVAVWSRRSALAVPTVELGGPPSYGAVSDISVKSVSEAWSDVASRIDTFDRTVIV